MIEKVGNYILSTLLVTDKSPCICALLATT